MRNHEISQSRKELGIGRHPLSRRNAVATLHGQGQRPKRGSDALFKLHLADCVDHPHQRC